MNLRSRGRQLIQLRGSLMPLLRRLGSISFSQYGEDVMLTSLEPQRTGFYIDVGAYHPWEGSNTYKLYLGGWSGITVEPNVDVAARFRRLRPRDTHLALGIAESRSKLTYYRLKNPLYNTFDLRPDSQKRADLLGEIVVDCIPLRELVSTYCPATPVDLLSVDCEGLDAEVLGSLDWNTTRPTAVIVEDFDQAWAVEQDAKPSRLCAFLRDRDYVPVAKNVFSFVYVDLQAFDRRDVRSGFALDRSQLRGVRRRFPATYGGAANVSAPGESR